VPAALETKQFILLKLVPHDRRAPSSNTCSPT
jgi:hypothetical protein